MVFELATQYWLENVFGSVPMAGIITLIFITILMFKFGLSLDAMIVILIPTLMVMLVNWLPFDPQVLVLLIMGVFGSMILLMVMKK